MSLILQKSKKDPVINYFRFPYYGDKGFQILKSYIRKIKLNCKNDPPVLFKILYGVCNVPWLCPGCGANYVRKTERIYMNDVLNMHGVIKTVF